MLRSFGTLYALLFGRPRLARFNRLLFHASARALGLDNYESLRLSGESRVIERHLAGLDRPVVFDVGANRGDWVAQVLRVNASARVHAFEPQEALAIRIGSIYPDVTVVTTAVGESSGRLELHDYADQPGSEHASLLRGVIDSLNSGPVRRISVPVITIDEYCATRGIEHIHFLKVDVEGFEMPVLRGARRMIEAGKVNKIQFEFNEMNIVGRTFFQDFARYLAPTFHLYRVLPHGLLRLSDKQHWFNEQYAFQNILAIRR